MTFNWTTKYIAFVKRRVAFSFIGQGLLTVMPTLHVGQHSGKYLWPSCKTGVCADVGLHWNDGLQAGSEFVWCRFLTKNQRVVADLCPPCLHVRHAFSLLRAHIEIART